MTGGGAPGTAPDSEGRTNHGANEGEEWRLRVTVVDHPEHAGWLQLQVSFPARVEDKLDVAGAIKALLGWGR